MLLSCKRAIQRSEGALETDQSRYDHSFCCCTPSVVPDEPDSPREPIQTRVKHAVCDVAIKDLPTPIRPLLFRSAVERNYVPTPPTQEPLPNTREGKRLAELRSNHPYIAGSFHYLNGLYLDCVRALLDADVRSASEQLSRLEMEIDLELGAIRVMFDLFRNPGTERLKTFELMRMLKYLGMPAEKTDALKIIETYDQAKEWNLTLNSFQTYVGFMGGSVRFFEQRKRVLWSNARSGGAHKCNRLLGDDESSKDLAELRQQLTIAGFQESEMVYWRLALPISESRATAALKLCQKAAIAHIRALARASHQKALPKLTRRAKELGYKADDIWHVLAWIRECAPIIIQLNLDSMMPPMNTDTHYRNQFETQCSGGLMNLETRRSWERNLFMAAYDQPDVQASDRVKYGVLNVMYDYRGVARTEMYGDSYLILKDVRLRCTFAPQDSANLSADKLAVLDYFAHHLLMYSNDELREVFKVATSDEPVVGDSCVVSFLKYKEAQIHGEISFSKHIERLVAHDRHKTGYARVFLHEICQKHGFELCWLSDEKARMEQERVQHLSPVGAMHLSPTGCDFSNGSDAFPRNKRKASRGKRPRNRPNAGGANAGVANAVVVKEATDIHLVSTDESEGWVSL